MVNSAPQTTPSTAPDLVSSSDTGDPSDNITKSKNPVFNAAVPANSRADLLRNGVLVGTSPFATSALTVQVTDGSSLTPDGTYSYSYSLEDLPGNVGNPSVALSVTIDNTPPAPPSSAPDLLATSDTGASETDNITKADTLSFQVSGIDPSIGLALLRDDAVVATMPASASTTRTIDDAPLHDETYLYSVEAIDAAGNSSSPSKGINVIVDRLAQAPDLTLLSSYDTGSSNTDNITNKTSLVFAVSGAEAAATVNLFRDGNRVVSAVASQIADQGPINDGGHEYLVTQIDLAGNVSKLSVPVFVVVDTVAPAAPSAPDLQAVDDTGVSNTDNITRKTALHIDVAGIESKALVALKRSTTSAFIVATATGPKVTLLDNSLTDSTFSYVATQTDVAGNQSAPSAALTPVTVDTTAPGLAITPVFPDPRPIPVDDIKLSFSEPVRALTNNDISLTRDNTALTGLLLSFTAAPSMKTFIAAGLQTLTAAPGNYNFTVGSKITDIAGNPLAGDSTESFAVVTPAATITNPSTSRSIYLKEDADATHLDIWIGAAQPGVGAPTQKLLMSDLHGPLAIDARTGHATVTLDYSAGSFLGTLGIGVMGAGLLAVRGTTAPDNWYTQSSGGNLFNAIPDFSNVQIAMEGIDNLQMIGSGGDTDTMGINGGNFTVDVGTPAPATPNIYLIVSGELTFVTFALTQVEAIKALAVTAGAIVQAPQGKKAVLIDIAGTLTVDPGSQFDLTRNALIVRGGDRAAIEKLVSQGYHNGDWLGNGLTSSDAQTSPTRVLGVARASDIGVTDFEGQSVPGNAVLVKYTYYGDFDLSGATTGDDEQLLLFGLRSGGAPLYAFGDADYSAHVTGDDYSLFLYGLKNQGPPIA
jgi:hypothetical protein